MRLKTFRERAMQGVFFLTALASIASVAIICVFLFINGVPAMAEIGFFDFIGGQKWAPTNVPASFGIFDMIVASVYVTAGAIVIGVPIGILTAVFRFLGSAAEGVSYAIIIGNLLVPVIEKVTEPTAFGREPFWKRGKKA